MDIKDVGLPDSWWEKQHDFIDKIMMWLPLPDGVEDVVSDIFHTAVDTSRAISEADWWGAMFNIGKLLWDNPILFYGTKFFQRWFNTAVLPGLLGIITYKAARGAMDELLENLVTDQLIDQDANKNRIIADDLFGLRPWYAWDGYIYSGLPESRATSNSPWVDIYLVPYEFGLGQSGNGPAPESSAGEAFDTFVPVPLPSSPTPSPGTWKIVYERSSICLGNQDEATTALTDWRFVTRESGRIQGGSPEGKFGSHDTQWSRDLYKRTIKREVTRNYYYDTRKVLIVTDERGNVSRKVLAVKRSHIVKGQLIVEDEYRWTETTYTPVLPYSGPDGSLPSGEAPVGEIEMPPASTEDAVSPGQMQPEDSVKGNEQQDATPTWPTTGSSVSVVTMEDDGTFTIASGKIAGALASWRTEGAVIDAKKRKDDRGNLYLTGSEFKSICESTGDLGTWNSLVQNGVSEQGSIIRVNGY